MGKPRRPALRYHGGKWLLAAWIVSLMPAHRIYVESHGGAGSVLLQKPRADTEVYNDAWNHVVNIFEVLRDPARAEELRRRCELTPYARAVFEEVTLERLDEEQDPIERARLLLFRSWSGFGSGSVNVEHSTGFRIRGRRSGGHPAREWATWPEEIRRFTERLRGVVIECRPAIELIARYDGPDTLFYVDPPYPQSTRNMRRGNANYVHEMTDDDHRELARVLLGLEGHVLISGYPCPLYDEELFPSWHRVTTTAIADSGGERVEAVWMPPRTRDAAARQLRLLEVAG